ncbi:MAG: EamA family transporter [Candidatus Desulforudis sp.]|nr:EamA family transporter [Desulforudis sp.]
MVYLYALAAVALGTSGQACLKMGATDLPVMKAVLQPWTLLGLLLYGGAMLFWLVVLSKLPLSTAYPLLALNFVLILLVSAVFLKEPVGVSKILGVTFIVCGIVLAGR